jgi:malate permease and related proteins
MDKVFLITGIFCLAMIFRRAGVVREKHLALLVRYVLTISLPCLTLMTIGALDLRNAHFDIAVIAWGVMLAGAAVSWGVGKLAGFEGARLRVFMLVTTFPNTGFLGYPFAFALFGATGLSYAVIYDQMGMFPIFVSLGFFIAGGKESLHRAFRFPPLIALLAALALNGAGYTITGPTARFLATVGWTTLPLTIFIIGFRVRLTALRDYKPVAWCLLVRMLILPAILLAILHFLGKNGMPYRVALMETAMPPALTTSILALQYRLDNDLAVACISVGTILSMILFTAAMLLQ